MTATILRPLCVLPFSIHSGANETQQCEKCIGAGVDCNAPSIGPCERCKLKKIRCNLMPVNPNTGKTDRRALGQTEHLEHRRNLKQVEKAAVKVKKGKKRAPDSPGEREPEASGSASSPFTQLAALGSLTLDSGGSSSANTPADSPASVTQAPLPEGPVPAPAKTPTASKTSKRSTTNTTPKAAAPARRSSNFVVEVPRAPKLLNPTPKASRSSDNASSVSDSGSNAARITALESRMGTIEELVRDMNQRLKESGI